MALRTKTVKYAFPTLNTLTENTTTTLTQTTVNIPETGSRTFRSVVATVSFMDLNTATGDSLDTKSFAMRLGANAYTTVNNTNAFVSSGENYALFFQVDFTSVFSSQFTGTSQTCDFQILINSTGNNANFANVSVTLDITYDFDDAVGTTRVKTVMIPLEMGTASLQTAVTTLDTIPALSTYLPEASKTFRNIHAVVQGNTTNSTSTTDFTLTLRIGAASVTSGNFEAGLASDRFFRYVWNVTLAYPSTSATQTWQPTVGAINRFNHLQAWLVVTYEFDASTTTSVMNSVMMPVELISPMASASTSDPASLSVDLWINEPGPITTNRIAFFSFWEQDAALSALNMRVGTGSFVAYTSAGNVFCGSNAAMTRNDAAYTLARGKNTLRFFLSTTPTGVANYSWGITGFWIVNYTSGKATLGVDAHNHTVEHVLSTPGTGGTNNVITTNAVAPVIADSNYMISNSGYQMMLTTTSTGQTATYSITAETLANENRGAGWLRLYDDAILTDPEAGTFMKYCHGDQYFRGWPTHPDTSLMDIEQTRRYRMVIQGTAVSGWFSLMSMITYHSIESVITGTVSGYVDADGAGLTVRAFSLLPNGQVLHVGTSTTGLGGTYAITWYDSANNVFATVHENATSVGTSALGTAV